MESEVGQDRPIVSIIIPTRNSCDTIETCLESIESQTYPNLQVIVVDTHSVDGTVEIARRKGSIIIQADSSRSGARNLGMAKAQGVFLLFVDSDMELAPDLVRQCVKKVEGNGLDAIMIPEVRVGHGFWAACRALERLTYVGDPLIESARFLRKEVVDSLGGFDEWLEAGEDWDLQARLEQAKYRIGGVRGFIRHNEGRLTLADLVRRRYFYGKSIMRYIRKNSGRAGTQFLPIRLNYIRNWRMLAKYPSHSLGMFLMRFVEHLAVLFGILLSLGVRKHSQKGLLSGN